MYGSAESGSGVSSDIENMLLRVICIESIVNYWPTVDNPIYGYRIYACGRTRLYQQIAKLNCFFYKYKFRSLFHIHIV